MLRELLLAALMLYPGKLSGQETAYARIKAAYTTIDAAVSIPEGDPAIIILGKEQKLYLVHAEQDSIIIDKEVQVSTGRNGIGNGVASHKTPPGIHMICTKAGDDASVGRVLRKAKLCDESVPVYTEKNKAKPVVITRLLQICGVEEQNEGTAKRGIYIHGTNLEWSLGQPHSDGCIRASNKDIIDLYEQVPLGTYVNIVH
ncbi:MAG: L,D-transpeptidase [archaeon]